MAPCTGSVGDSYDNAVAENLWSAIKVEPLYWPGTSFATRAQAEAAIFRYIDGWFGYVGHLGVSAAGVAGAPGPCVQEVGGVRALSGSVTARLRGRRTAFWASIA